MSNLKTCPFCGGRASRHELEDGGSVIECAHCHASSPVHYGRCENLVASWNDRTLPKGIALVPREITAETGHKAGMIGDFNESVEVMCSECCADDPDPECGECDGLFFCQQEVAISWPTLKAIHRRIVELSEQGGES